MGLKLNEENMFELGRLGESVESIATRLSLSVPLFYNVLSSRPEMMTAHRRGLQVYHDAYRVSMIPVVKEAFLEKIKAGDTKAILWAMDNLVMVETAHPGVFDNVPGSILRGTEAEQKLPPVNEEERRARVESLLSIYTPHRVTC